MSPGNLVPYSLKLIQNKISQFSAQAILSRYQFCVCVPILLLVRISQMNFCELGQIAKTQKFYLMIFPTILW